MLIPAVDFGDEGAIAEGVELDEGERRTGRDLFVNRSTRASETFLRTFRS